MNPEFYSLIEELSLQHTVWEDVLNWETARSQSTDPWDDDTEEIDLDDLEELLNDIRNAIDDEEFEIDWGSSGGCSNCNKDCDGKDGNDQCPDVCDSECISGSCGENKKCRAKKCECGASSVGGLHSSWCPLYEK